MARLVLNRDGGKTDELGHILGLSRFMSGEVIEGLNVTAQSSPNMSVKVDAGSAKIPYGTGGTRYSYWVANDADYSVTIATADPANPRIDYVIGVVDRTVTPSTGVTNNSNNMFKIIAVAGTPAASPSVPTSTQLQTAAGTGNPYILLRRINVPAGVTQITSGQVSTDLRTFAYALRTPTASIEDNAITTSKIADNNVTAAKIDWNTAGIAGGFFVANSSTITISGLGFAPREIEFMFFPGTSTSATYDSYGFAIKGGAQLATATYGNASGNQDRRTSSETDSILATGNTANIVVGKVTSWNSGGVTITLSTVGGGGDRFMWRARQ